MLFNSLAALAAIVLSAAGIEAADWKADKAAASVSVARLEGWASDADRGSRRAVDASLTASRLGANQQQSHIVKGKYIIEYRSDASRKRDIVSLHVSPTSVALLG